MTENYFKTSWLPAAPQYYQPHLKETGVSLLLAIRLLKQENPQNENIPRNFILRGEGSGHGARQRRNLFPRKRVHALLISGPAEVGIWDEEWLMIRRTTLLPGLYLNLILLSGCQRMNLRQSVIEPLQLSLIPISFTVTCLWSGQTGQILCTHWLYILPRSWQPSPSTLPWERAIAASERSWRANVEPKPCTSILRG